MAGFLVGNFRRNQACKNSLRKYRKLNSSTDNMMYPKSFARKKYERIGWFLSKKSTNIMPASLVDQFAVIPF